MYNPHIVKPWKHRHELWCPRQPPHKKLDLLNARVTSTVWISTSLQNNACVTTSEYLSYLVWFLLIQSLNCPTKRISGHDWSDKRAHQTCQPLWCLSAPPALLKIEDISVCGVEVPSCFEQRLWTDLRQFVSIVSKSLTSLQISLLLFFTSVCYLCAI